MARWEDGGGCLFFYLLPVSFTPSSFSLDSSSDIMILDVLNLTAESLRDVNIKSKLSLGEVCYSSLSGTQSLTLKSSGRACLAFSQTPTL